MSADRVPIYKLEVFDYDEPLYQAVCQTCGWKSQPVQAAGIAGTLWDDHVAEAHHPPT